ncbi:hypothetical protein EON65_46535 [archaeon]|nr:MAG: hypothetical protein EON65_46535 [archaeon]
MHRIRFCFILREITSKSDHGVAARLDSQISAVVELFRMGNVQPELNRYVVTVLDNTVARNKEELWSNVEVALQYMWSEDMTNKIQTLYESLPRRMEAVIAHSGNTSY